MNLPNHIAIIMDGNGRWATSKNKPRTYGHSIGVKTINKIVEAAIKNKIKFLTLFAFSIENFQRPKKEVNFLMKLFDKQLNAKLADQLIKNNISLKWIGFKRGLSKQLVNKIIQIEETTKQCHGLILSICFNYGGQQDLENAFKNHCFSSFKKNLLTKNLPPVDLLIRTGNEKRISNFLLYDIAYAEIIFEKTMWPAYNSNNFSKNLLEYSNRKRRFGKI